MAFTLHTTTTYSLPADTLTDLIDDAGMVIGYWASKAVVDDDNRTYTITETDSGKTYTLTYSAIFHALVALATTYTDIRKDIKQTCLEMITEPDADYDAEIADCVIQYACFGEIIYG